MFSVSGSMSTTTGTRPCWMRGQTVVDQDKAGTITSSPGWSRGETAGLHSAETASRFADDPEFTITPWPKPSFWRTPASKRRTFSPIVTRVVTRHFSAAQISSGPNVASCRRMDGLRGSKGRGAWPLQARSRARRSAASGPVTSERPLEVEDLRRLLPLRHPASRILVDHRPRRGGDPPSVGIEEVLEVAGGGVGRGGVPHAAEQRKARPGPLGHRGEDLRPRPARGPTGVDHEEAAGLGDGRRDGPGVEGAQGEAVDDLRPDPHLLQERARPQALDRHVGDADEGDVVA